MSQLLNVGNSITAGTDPYQFYNFRERVLADGATVLSGTQVSDEIKRLRSLGLYSKFSALYTPAVRNTGKLYSLISADGDATVVRGSVKNINSATGTLEQIASNVTPSSFGTGGWGALVEGARTNSIRNNTMAGAVVGAPGTVPNFWEFVELRGLTPEILAISTIGEINYIDVRMSGVASSTGSIRIAFEDRNIIAATNGQTFTNSFYFALLAAPNAPNDYNVTTRYLTSAFGSALSVQMPFTPNADFLRRISTSTAVNTTAWVRPEVNFGATNGQSYDFTVRIGLPQIEQGGSASSPIKTSSGAATRPIDAIEDTGAPELTTGGLYAIADLRLLNQTRTIKASGTNASNGYFLLVTSTNRIRMEVRVAGVVTGSVETGTITAGLRKVAGLWTPSGIALYVDGVAIGTAVPSSLPASTATTSIGSDFGAVALNDRLTLCGVINDALTNSQAIALTT
jgi:hypothetical protein